MGFHQAQNSSSTPKSRNDIRNLKKKLNQANLFIQYKFATSCIPIFAKLYDFYKNLSQEITTFPKTKRYTLGQRLDSLTLDIFELLFSVPNSKNKLEVLLQISIKLDLIKILLRLSKDTQAIKNNKYLELQAVLQEIGKMLGGWIRSTKQSFPIRIIFLETTAGKAQMCGLPSSRFQSLTFS
ncbi:diversity-generating retroelement protein Avd [Candidatus Curtissbacteria bacterium]|nr:diversity-generating retroelement protein Avd [Candidatus Curtissbacteria bacterium]